MFTSHDQVPTCHLTTEVQRDIRKLEYSQQNYYNLLTKRQQGITN